MHAHLQLIPRVMIHPPPGSHLIPGPCPLPTRPHWYAPRRQGYEEREGAGCHLGGGQRWLLGRYHAACPKVEWGAAGGGREGEAQPPDPAGQPVGGGGRVYMCVTIQACLDKFAGLSRKTRDGLHIAMPPWGGDSLGQVFNHHRWLWSHPRLPEAGIAHTGQKPMHAL